MGLYSRLFNYTHIWQTIADKLDIMEIHLAPKRSYVITGPLSNTSLSDHNLLALMLFLS